MEYRIDSFFLTTKTRFTMKVYLLLISLLITGLLSAQSEECGTVVTAEQAKHLNQQYRARVGASNALKNGNPEPNYLDSTIINIPVVNHILRRSDKTGGLTEEDIDEAMNELNTFYARIKIQFYKCQPTSFIDSNEWFDFVVTTPTQNAIIGPNNIQNVINIYYFNDMRASSDPSSRQYCGYTYLPDRTENIIMMRNECVFNGSTLIHEVGHYFSLLHTHGRYPMNCGGTDELVDGSNCEDAADGICDTPADPNLRHQDGACEIKNYLVDENCEYIGGNTILDANDQPYAPLTDNIMSYSPRECRAAMTAEQYQRIRLSARYDYTFKSDCPISYCEAEGSDTSFEFIQSVKVDYRTYESGDDGGYADFPFQFTAQTGPTQVTLTPGFHMGAYDENWSIWVDGNRDGDFNDPNELIFSGTSFDGAPLTGWARVPGVAGNGITTLRVVMEYANIPESCGSFRYGEVEDYLVYVSAVGDRIAVENQLIQVYPNPTRGLLNVDLQQIIQTGDVGSITATVYAMDGKQVYEQNMEAMGTIRVSTHHLPKGSYILRLRTNDGKAFSSRFVKL